MLWDFAVGARNGFRRALSLRLHHDQTTAPLKNSNPTTGGIMREGVFKKKSPQHFHHNIISCQCQCFSTQGNSSNNDGDDDLEKTAYRLLYVALEEDDKMQLSALYMQATEGQCSEIEPDPSPSKSKSYELQLQFWKDWKGLGNMPKEEAVKKYLAIAKKYV